MELTHVNLTQIDTAMEIIDMAKAHLRDQGIDQWQSGYPDYDCIKRDILNQKGFFITEKTEILGYLCIDFEGESAYNGLKGTWQSDAPYVVVHRMAFHTSARAKGLSDGVFHLVEQLSASQGVRYFRVDTDADNTKMQHVLKKNGFTYCGTIWFDNSEKIAFDKMF